MTVKKGLGRGLDALIASAQTESLPQELDILLIDPNPDQPRQQFDEVKMEELARSIALHGVIQPILVVQRGGRYSIVAGERRWRASRIAGLSQIPALVREYTPRQISEISLVENLQRDDLNPLDEAAGIRSLLETFELTQEQIGERLGMSRPAVSNSLRLLGLPEEVQKYLREGKLSAGHGRTLAGIVDVQMQILWAQRAYEQGMSVRELERQVTTPQQESKRREKVVHEPIEGFSELEDNLMRMMGTQVKIYGTPKKGRIVIEYYQADDLERIFETARQYVQEKDIP